MELLDQIRFIYSRMLAEARGFGLEIDNELSDPDRPWGSYLRFKDSSVPAFFEAYWTDIHVKFDFQGHRIDPKILMVAPGARLSLQYHNRRQELWRVLVGPVKIVLGPDGTSLIERIVNMGELIEIPKGYWHRLGGGSNWGVVAEIWEHIDGSASSDEDDIVRIADDYSRK